MLNNYYRMDIPSSPAYKRARPTTGTNSVSRKMAMCSFAFRFYKTQAVMRYFYQETKKRRSMHNFMQFVSFLYTI